MFSSAPYSYDPHMSHHHYLPLHMSVLSAARRIHFPHTTTAQGMTNATSFCIPSSPKTATGNTGEKRSVSESTVEDLRKVGPRAQDFQLECLSGSAAGRTLCAAASIMSAVTMHVGKAEDEVLQAVQRLVASLFLTTQKTKP